MSLRPVFRRGTPAFSLVGGAPPARSVPPRNIRRVPPLLSLPLNGGVIARVHCPAAAARTPCACGISLVLDRGVPPRNTLPIAEAGRPSGSL
jgi:hypothetical protein